MIRGGLPNLPAYPTLPMLLATVIAVVQRLWSFETTPLLWNDNTQILGE